MMRERRKQIAYETLKIQQQGFYVAASGNRVDISCAQKRSEVLSKLFTPKEGIKVMESLPAPRGSSGTSYEIINASTIKAIISESETAESLAALNFASAKNPGGGFLNGAIAQEESLALASGLYNTQICNMEYYDSNQKCKSMMYTDYSIYSPNVVFFRDENDNLLEAIVTASILTLPAVNMNQIQAKGEDLGKAKAVMKNRMRLSLAILASEQNEAIILGAYGCGVFGNDPNDVARWWRELLVDEKYGCYFKRVLFAVLDKHGGENIGAFERIIY